MNPWQQPPNQSGWGTPPSQYPYGSAPGSPYGQPSGYVPSPSGGTAITAAVLSFLGAAHQGLGGFGGLIGLITASSLSDYGGVSVGIYGFQILVSLAIAAGLTVGGIMLLRRKLIGRIIIAVSCGLVIVLTIINFAFIQYLWNSYGLSGYSLRGGLLMGTPALALEIIMAGTTMTLALVPPTVRWCLSGPARMPMQPPGPW